MPRSKTRRGRRPYKARPLPRAVQIKADSDKANSYIKVAGRMGVHTKSTPGITIARHIGLQTGQPAPRGYVDTGQHVDNQP